jgi:1-deoxy-D-xylulose-5-phosphate reductoisomerase
MKRVTVLGATGSVGRRSLELVQRFPDEFRLVGMAARGTNPELIAELAAKHRPQALALSISALPTRSRDSCRIPDPRSCAARLGS